MYLCTISLTYAHSVRSNTKRSLHGASEGIQPPVVRRAGVLVKSR